MLDRIIKPLDKITNLSHKYNEQLAIFSIAKKNKYATVRSNDKKGGKGEKTHRS